MRRIPIDDFYKLSTYKIYINKYCVLQRLAYKSIRNFSGLHSGKPLWVLLEEYLGHAEHSIQVFPS